MLQLRPDTAQGPLPAQDSLVFTAFCQNVRVEKINTPSSSFVVRVAKIRNLRHKEGFFRLISEAELGQSSETRE